MSNTAPRNGPVSTVGDPPVIQPPPMRAPRRRRVRRIGRTRWCMALGACPSVVSAGSSSRTPGARDRRRTHSFLSLAIGIAFASGVAAPSALAAGTPFQRGDVFLTGSGSVQEFSPSGQLQQTVPGTSGASALCFDPSGRHLILPGVGLFDRSGNLLPSNWASVTGGDACVADGFGDVYVSGGSGCATPTSCVWTITKYDIKGDPVETFQLADTGGFGTLAEDLAPDECTMYYGRWNGNFGASIGRFNVCTKVQDTTFNGWPATDDLRVLPNWQVLVTDDPGGLLFDTSGLRIRQYPAYSEVGNSLRYMSLDPDGTSFWMSGAGIVRYDINTGTLLSVWGTTPPSSNQPTAHGPIAVYGPPLLGNADIESTVDSDSAGTAEAFVTQPSYSGQLSGLRVYVDSSSTATKMIVGVYSNRNGHPGALQEQATITNVMVGSWNYVTLPSTLPVTAGQSYWIAVLGPSGGGTLSFRDKTAGGRSKTSSQHKLSALPASWSTAKTWTTGSLSAYGN
jgi:hypothetical protein